MDGILGLADGIAQELQRLLPRQRKTQRNGLALLVATMLDVRSANLMDLAAGLPRSVARIDLRYQWISRVLMNPLIEPDAVMAPFAREALSRLATDGQPLVLIMDQSKLNDRHQVLMLAVRFGECALPLLWRVEETEGADLLLHVLDASHPLAFSQAEAVREVLRMLGLDDKPVMTVLNKRDLLEDANRLTALERQLPEPIAISALHGEGLETLLTRIDTRLATSTMANRVAPSREPIAD